MQAESVESGFLKIFLLLTFFIFLITNKYSYKLNNGVLLDKDFSKFMEYLDNVVVELESDLFCKYKTLTLNIREFINSILVGLYNLKKTYPDCKEVVSKVDCIILTLIDFKDKSESYVNQKNTNIKLTIGQTFQSQTKTYEI